MYVRGRKISNTTDLLPGTRHSRLICRLPSPLPTRTLPRSVPRLLLGTGLIKKKGVPFEQVDGSEGSDREIRNTLWSVSGHRGKYPQVCGTYEVCTRENRWYRRAFSFFLLGSQAELVFGVSERAAGWKSCLLRGGNLGPLTLIFLILYRADSIFFCICATPLNVGVFRSLITRHTTEEVVAAEEQQEAFPSAEHACTHRRMPVKKKTLVCDSRLCVSPSSCCLKCFFRWAAIGVVMPSVFHTFRPSIAQVFIERDGEHEFVGLWSDVESLNECEALPPEVSGSLVDLFPCACLCLRVCVCVCRCVCSWCVRCVERKMATCYMLLRHFTG